MMIFVIENRLWKLKIHQFEAGTWRCVNSQKTQFPRRPLLLLVLLCKNYNSYIFPFFFSYRRHVEVFWVLIFPWNFFILFFVYPHYTSTFSQLKTSIRLSHVQFVLLNLECNEQVRDVGIRKSWRTYKRVPQNRKYKHGFYKHRV